jgi:anti-sigma regulatory factor (Ser/Thr protein kinase)
MISRLNDLLVSMGRRRSATLAILELDLTLGELEVLSAGHVPPLMISPAGEASLLEQHNGVPVGVSSRQRYVTRRYSFPTGSTLLLYTDGLIERRGESIEEGFERLTAAALAAAKEDDSSFADRVYRSLLAEVPLEDDVALLAVESLPMAEVLELTLSTRPDVLGGLRNTLERWLAGTGASEDEIFDIALSASEAATNAIEHAYGARDASFSVRCGRDDDEVTVTITDEGRWRTLRAHGGGRGLTIMRSLMDSVEVESDEQGTVVTLTKSLAGA